MLNCPKNYLRYIQRNTAANLAIIHSLTSQNNYRQALTFNLGKDVIVQIKNFLEKQQCHKGY